MWYILSFLFFIFALWQVYGSYSNKQYENIETIFLGSHNNIKFQIHKEFQHSSLIKFFPKTGRTHQIRVNSDSIGHPIFGDEKYGGGLAKSKGYIDEYSRSYYKFEFK